MSGPNLTKSKKQITAELNMLNSMYKDLDEDLKALHEKAAAYNSDSNSDDKLTALRDEQDKITKKYGAQLLTQLEDFFKGPRKDDPESISDWISRNYLAVRLYTSEDYTHLNRASIGKYETFFPHSAAIAKIFTSVFNPEGVFLGSDKPVKNPVDAYKSYMKPHVEAALKDYNSKKNLIEEAKREIRKMAPAREFSVYEKDRDTLGLFAVDLECAATFTNSAEYKDIIKAVKALNKNDPLPGGANDLNDDGQYAAKLIDVKEKISSYIEHKAEDGVKKNVYNKLAAVEKLNKFISGRIKELIPAYQYNDPDVNTLNNYTEKEVSGKLKNKPEAERCFNALDFMGRIICKAQQKRVAPKQLMDLKNMQTEFFENPGPEEPKAEAVKTVSSPLGKKASEAIETGIKMGYMKPSTQKLLLAAEKDDSFTFETSMELACRYAQLHKMEIEIHYEGEDVTLPIDEVISKTEFVAKKASSFAGKNEEEADFWRALAKDNFQRVQSDVRSRLYNEADAELANFSKNFTDEELVNEWPLLSFKARCYSEITYNNDEVIKKILEKSNELTARMESLSKGTVRSAEKKGEEKTQNAELIH